MRKRRTEKRYGLTVWFIWNRLNSRMTARSLTFCSKWSEPVIRRFIRSKFFHAATLNASTLNRSPCCMAETVRANRRRCMSSRRVRAWNATHVSIKPVFLRIMCGFAVWKRMKSRQTAVCWPATMCLTRCWIRARLTTAWIRNEKQFFRNIWPTSAAIFSFHPWRITSSFV